MRNIEEKLYSRFEFSFILDDRYNDQRVKVFHLKKFNLLYF
jgi:hypothetical protein